MIIQMKPLVSPIETITLLPTIKNGEQSKLRQHLNTEHESKRNAVNHLIRGAKVGHWYLT